MSTEQQKLTDRLAGQIVDLKIEILQLRQREEDAHSIIDMMLPWIPRVGSEGQKWTVRGRLDQLREASR